MILLGLDCFDGGQQIKEQLLDAGRGGDDLAAGDQAVPGFGVADPGAGLAQHGDGAVTVPRIDVRFIVADGATAGDVDQPKLTPELREKLVAGAEKQAGDRSLAEMEKERDACLAVILKAIAGVRGS